MPAATSLLVAALIWAFCLAGGAIASEQPNEVYPIWWSPFFELESLDDIDERLAQPIWPTDLRPDHPGYRLYIGIGKNRRTEIARSCADVRRYEKEAAGALDTPENNLWLIVKRRCVPMETLREAKPAEESHVRNFTMTADAVKYLPAIMMMSASCGGSCRLYVANARRISWADFETRGFVSVKATSEYELEVETDSDEIHVEILARADFTGDGMEDLFVWSTAISKEGRWGDNDLFLLSRETDDGVLEVLNAETYLCRDYGECDTHYNEPPALR